MDGGAEARGGTSTTWPGGEILISGTKDRQTPEGEKYPSERAKYIAVER